MYQGNIEIHHVLKLINYNKPLGMTSQFYLYIQKHVSLNASSICVVTLSKLNCDTTPRGLLRFINYNITFYHHHFYI